MDIENCPEAHPTKLKISEPVIMHVYQESEFTQTEARECIVKYSEEVFYCDKSQAVPLVPSWSPEAVNISRKIVIRRLKQRN